VHNLFLFLNFSFVFGYYLNANTGRIPYEFFLTLILFFFLFLNCLRKS
jgi:hypothetical protein